MTKEAGPCFVWWDLGAWPCVRNYVHCKVKFVYMVHFESSVLKVQYVIVFRNIFCYAG